MHAITGGAMSAMEGGKFLSGMLSGAVSSLIASGVQALGNTGSRMFVNNDGYLDIGTFAERNPGLLKAMMVASGGLSGGISSSIAGGKFMDGFRQGIITAGLNHVAHLTSDSFPKNDSELNDSELLVLLDAQGGSGLGYTGMAGGNDDKGWDYVSNEGAKKWKLYNWRRFKSC